jgi:hypothetical protein
VVALKAGAIAATFVAAGAVTSVEVKHTHWRAAHRSAPAPAASTPTAAQTPLAGRLAVAGKSSRTPRAEVAVHPKLHHPASIARARPRPLPVRSARAMSEVRSNEHAEPASRGRSSNGRSAHDKSSPVGRKLGTSHNDHSSGHVPPKADRGRSSTSHGRGKHAAVDISGELPAQANG